MILTKTDWQTLRASIRAELKPPAEWKALSDTSQRNYSQKFASLGGKLPAEVAKCKKTYYTLRAAYLHGQSRAIRAKLNELDTFIRTLNLSDNVAANQLVMEKINALGIRADMDQFMTVKNAPAFVGSLVGVDQPSHGKRKVGNLPRGWKGQLVGRVPKESKYRRHVALMALCGCRPSEFETGIVVKQKDDDTFWVMIDGTKTGVRTKDGKTFTTGQTKRILELKRGDTLDEYGYVNTEFLMLERALKGKKEVLLTAKATAIRDVVIRASKKAFPELKNRPTAYSFRHAFASELKAANGEGSVDTAAALGHASTKTQGCYGYGRSGRSGGVVCRAKAYDPIRSPKVNRANGLSQAATRRAAKSVQTAAPAVAMPAPNAAKVLMPAPSFSWAHRKIKKKTKKK